MGKIHGSWACCSSKGFSQMKIKSQRQKAPKCILDIIFNSHTDSLDFFFPVKQTGGKIAKVLSIMA